MMQISDWVLIWSTITLAVTALIAPHVYDWVKRKWFAPKLEIEFSHEPPYCHKTKLWGAPLKVDTKLRNKKK